MSSRGGGGGVRGGDQGHSRRDGGGGGSGGDRRGPYSMHDDRGGGPGPSGPDGYGARGVCGSGYDRSSDDPRAERGGDRYRESGRQGHGGGGGGGGGVGGEGAGEGGRGGGGGGRGYGGARGGGYERDTKMGGGRPSGGVGGARQAANDREQKEKDAAPREQGFVKTLTKSYGFVQSADSEVQLFFHYSELLGGADEKSLRAGSELEYGFYASRDKPMAVRINVLPQGTIKLEIPIATDACGVIAKEPKETQSRGYDRNKREQIMGKIKLLPGQVGEGEVKLPEVVSFGLDDIAVASGAEAVKYQPGEGDEVKFDIIMVRATRQRKASNVRLIKGAEKPFVPRETGVVEALKEKFGFIKCADRAERLFFHLSEIKDRTHNLRNGDEFEFIVTTDREKRNVASDMTVLPKGTVTFTTVLDGRLKGLVSREMRAGGGQRGSGGFGRDVTREMYGGIIIFGEEKLAFEGEDLEDAKGLMPLLGDEVEFNVCIDKPTKKRKATAVKVSSFAKAGREQGVVTKVKEGVNYAFIRCCDREDAVFFHFNECEGQTAANGDEIEFAISEGKSDGRMTATRICKLPAGTVSFEQVLEGRFEGRVQRLVSDHGAASSRRSNKDHAVSGMIFDDSAKGHEDSSEGSAAGGKFRDPELKMLSFSSSDLENAAVVLCKGDRVSYSAVLDRPSKKRRATKIALVSAALADGEGGDSVEIGPETGVILQVKFHHGYIRCAERDTRLYFLFSDVDAESLAAASSNDTSHSTNRSAVDGEYQGGAAHDGDAVDDGETCDGSAEQKEHEEGSEEGPKKGKTRKPRVGDEVEFMIKSEPKTRVIKAVKVKVLPKGTVIFERELEGRHKGVVERELTFKSGGKDNHVVGTGGLVKLVEGETVASLPFTSNDMENPLSQVKHGETIEFTTFLDKPSGDRRAGKVAVSLSEGYVEAAKEGYGYIKADADDGPHPKLIYFSTTDVEKGDQGKIDKGDSVAFFLIYNAGKKEVCAVRVKRTFRPAHAAEKMPEHMRRQQEVPKIQQRLASGPDGTRGFSAGRGKAMESAAQKELDTEAPAFVPGGIALDPGRFSDAA